MVGVINAADELDFFSFYKNYFRRLNCFVYNVDTEVCITCADGYYLVKNRCCKTDEYPF